MLCKIWSKQLPRPSSLLLDRERKVKVVIGPYDVKEEWLGVVLTLRAPGQPGTFVSRPPGYPRTERAVA
jgi:hypothetical protein